MSQSLNAYNINLNSYIVIKNSKRGGGWGGGGGGGGGGGALSQAVRRIGGSSRVYKIGLNDQS